MLNTSGNKIAIMAKNSGNKLCLVGKSYTIVEGMTLFIYQVRRLVPMYLIC